MENLMRFAVIESGVVINVIVADQEFVNGAAAPGRIYVCVDTIPCGPGWTYNGTVFTPPAEPPPE